MDTDTAELIRTLLTRTGMIMEDASTMALMLVPTSPTFVEQLAALARDIDAASNLLRSAAVVYARSNVVTS